MEIGNNTYKLAISAGYSKIALIPSPVYKVGRMLKMDGYTRQEVVPTQTELQKWLREEKYVDVFVVPAIKECHYEYLICRDDEKRVEAHEAYQQFEDAMEVGLIKALKLLINKSL